MDDSPQSDSPPPPIERAPSFIQFTPKRAMASFENLVALANYEERLREARKIVWRDRGERPVECEDYWDCLEHASRGFLRAGTLAFAIRSGVNIILLLTRIKSIPRRRRFALIRHALFGEDSWRFAAMLGSFVGLYKMILNSLPLLLPDPPLHHTSTASLRSELNAHPDASHPSSSSPFHEEDELHMSTHKQKPSSRRRARLSSSAQAHQVWVRKKTRRWYAILAGTLAGSLAILFEKKGRRVGIAQQMFVRGLQGSYNALSHKHGFRIPHGDVIVFSLCSAQIMYGYLLRPDTLPRSYVSWIQSASKVPKRAVKMNRDLVRDGFFDPADIHKLVSRKDITPSNATSLLDRLALASDSVSPSFGPLFGPCQAVHPCHDSCLMEPTHRFLEVFKWILPIYGVLHFVPMLLFKRGRFLKDPLHMLVRAGWGTTRSSAFLGVYVVIYQAFFCFKHNIFDGLSSLRAILLASKRPSPLFKLMAYVASLIQPILISKPSFWLGGLMSGFSLFVEDKKRREELAMYVLPKGLESAWVMARGKGLVFGTGDFGDILLTALGMGMVMSIYQNDPQHLSGLVRRILYQFVGPN